MNGRNWKVEVGTTPTMIAPAFYKDPNDYPILAGGAVEAGSYYRGHAWDGTRESSQFYWTPNGGTATMLPTHKYGAKTLADGITWVCIGLSRQFLDLSADVDNPVFVFDGAAGSEDEGLKLDAYRPAYTYENYNGEVFAQAESGTAIIGVKER